MRCKISDIADVLMGQSPKSEFYNSNGDGIEFLQGNRTFGLKYPTFDTFTTKITKLAKANDIIMSVRAPVGDLNITPIDICLGRGVCSFRMKNGNQQYLFYLLKHYMKQLINRENGTVFGSVNKNDIISLDINIETNEEKQREIGSFLSKIDDKIELNNKINENLEQQAQAVFRSWFVDFEPFGGVMPSDWEAFNLEKIAVIDNGYSYKGKELQSSNIAMATIKNFDRNGGFKLDGFKEIIPSVKIKSSHYVKKFDILVAHTDLTQNADIIGNAELLLSSGEYKSVVASMDLVKVTSKENFNQFLLASLLKSKLFKTHALGYVNGTTVLHLSKKALKEYIIYLPKDLSLLNKISLYLENVYLKISANIDENQQLIQLRDTLLPKLMSGELDVSGLDI